MIKFKSSEDLAFDAFYSCHILGCDFEAEKIYPTESNIVDLCLKHYNELTDRDYR